MKDRLMDLLSYFGDGYNVDKRRIHATVGEVADYLIENGVVVLPCKVGEKIYFVTYDYDVNHHIRYYISEGEIQSFAVYNDGVWAYSRHSDGLTFWHKTDSFGINVFFTREDAEKSIAERSNR